MKMVRTAAPCLFAAAAFIAISIAGAQAQTKDAAPAPVGSEPQTTSATYGDWVLRCSRNGDAPTAPRICEIVQSFQIQGQQGLYAQLAIGRVSPKDPLKITVVMQPNISFPSSIKLSIDEKDTQSIELVWRRCLPGGCFADAEVKDDDMKRWKAQTGNGRLLFKDGAGHDVPLPFSFRGLPQALDGLAKS